MADSKENSGPVPVESDPVLELYDLFVKEKTSGISSPMLVILQLLHEKRKSAVTLSQELREVESNLQRLQQHGQKLDVKILEARSSSDALMEAAKNLYEEENKKEKPCRSVKSK